MVSYSLNEKRAIAWRLRAEGITAREISERYGWGRPVIYSWGKGKADWEEKKRERRVRLREVYRIDPEHRRKARINHKKWWAEHREEVLSAERKRRVDDPEWREQENKKSREYHRLNRVKISARNREKYRTNPEYRERILANSKEWQDEHPEEHRRRSRDWYRKKYHITPDRYYPKEN